MLRQLDRSSVLVAVASSVLHGPQRTQRGLLLLGQAPDPCDIKALVGPVASQRAQSLATLEVPEHNGPVIAATGEPAAIGTPLHAVHGPAMFTQHPGRRRTCHLPQGHPSSSACTAQLRALP